MKFNFDKKKIKKLTEFSVVLVPHDASTGTKTVKLSFYKILAIAFVYTLVIMLVGFYLITFSSADKILLPDSYRYNTPEKVQLRELNEKIVKLANEVQKLKSNNERLKNILLQQDSQTRIERLKHRLRIWQEKIANAGLTQTTDTDQFKERYFKLHLKCPFLNNDKSCSIYPVRPTPCRTYFSFGNPQLCMSSTFI
ncbi:MAG: YkgJ family cysteine cluster protein, partial [Ignavibacterium sp.]|nr:YkgJ family cysteine cluster protein [Ignavibacterium sp.]